MSKSATTTALLILALTGCLAAVSPSSSFAALRSMPSADIAKPTMQPLLQFDFTPPKWGMPEGTDWTYLDFSLIALGAGKSFDTNKGWYLSTDGSMLLYLLDGELSVTPAGPSLVYRSSAPDQPPTENAAGQAVLLEPGDGIVCWIHDTIIARNTGTVKMHALIGLTGSVIDLPDGGNAPSDVQRDLFTYSDYPPMPASGARASLQQLVLRPYDTYIFENVEQLRMIALAPDTQTIYWYFGAFDSVSPGDKRIRVASTTVFGFLGKGSYTMVNLGSEPATVYFFAVEPYPNPATPIS